jgi:hypothetical protein
MLDFLAGKSYNIIKRIPHRKEDENGSVGNEG